ncbi:mitochondrial ribosomal subunit protein-domain-containing protein [Dichotomopilus funicola]|uniref:Mitochondrial ribosomal subunit protein-domain-containing protein n=1 Tax=Dichotomopilus funicola TaxID=1934379 RepID=A0AAN6UZS8_9PEZI|nr:mitochondrial ribosomal subunit protein-domain-containing protein [Dichotomopilus funicola]
MATPANLLRLCLRPNRRLSTVYSIPFPRPATSRPLSTTQWRGKIIVPTEEEKAFTGEPGPDIRNPGEFLAGLLEEEDITNEEREEAQRMLADWEKLDPKVKREYDTLREQVDEGTRGLRALQRVKRSTFWHEDEVDNDMLTDEVGEDDFEEDDIMAMGHAKLEEHREFREYARLAVWEMPLLSRLAKPFQPPTEQEILRFRYTTYLGEVHPSDRKVVVEFCPSDVPGLTPAQQLKLKKLAGARFNPEKEIVKMSCERFEHQAQNKRYLGDLVDKLIAAAKDPTDMFEDIPLDTRHHKFKPKIRFPKDWHVTEERKKQLGTIREQALLLDESKRKEGALVDGVRTIQEALNVRVDGPVLSLKGRPTPSLRASR